MAVVCPSCDRDVPPGAWICPHCEFILDASVLDSGAPRPQTPVWSETGDAAPEAMILGDVNIDPDDFQVMPGAGAGGDGRTSTFLFYTSGATSRVLRPDVVPALTAAARGASRVPTTPYEDFILAAIDGRRTVREIQRSSGLAPQEVTITLLTLLDKQVIRIESPRSSAPPPPANLDDLPVARPRGKTKRRGSERRGSSLQGSRSLPSQRLPEAVTTLPDKAPLVTPSDLGGDDLEEITEFAAIPTPPPPRVEPEPPRAREPSKDRARRKKSARGRSPKPAPRPPSDPTQSIDASAIEHARRRVSSSGEVLIPAPPPAAPPPPPSDPETSTTGAAAMEVPARRTAPPPLPRISSTPPPAAPLIPAARSSTPPPPRSSTPPPARSSTPPPPRASRPAAPAPPAPLPPPLPPRAATKPPVLDPSFLVEVPPSTSGPVPPLAPPAAPRIEAPRVEAEAPPPRPEPVAKIEPQARPEPRGEKGPSTRSKNDGPRPQVDGVMMAKAAKLFEEALRDKAEGNLVSARMNMKLAMTFDPGNPLYAEAFEELAKAAPAGGGNTTSRARELYDRATDAERMGRVDEAIDLLERALEEAKEPAFYNRLGVLLAMKKGEFIRAQRLIETALELSPGNSTYQHNLGKVLQMAASKELSARDAGPDRNKKGLFGSLLGKRK